jgi:hypothetical protein
MLWAHYFTNAAKNAFIRIDIHGGFLGYSTVFKFSFHMLDGILWAA